VKAEIAALRAEFELLQGDLTIRLGSMMIAMRDVEVETLAGVVLGHRHIPVGRVAATSREAAIRWWRRRI
jgi:hypothetical protein